LSLTILQFKFENFGGTTVKGHSHSSHSRKPIRVFGSVTFSLSLLCALVIALLIPRASYSQDTGYISGTVIDKSGAAIAGADVVLTNIAGSLTRATTTNSDGAYVIPGLQGDTYNLSVSAKGFQRYTAQRIKLDVAEKARVDVTLTVGAMSEEITVTGEAVAQVETESSEIGSTITGKQVNQLELNGRNFTQLVTLTPGVVDQTNSDEGKVGVYGNVSYSINGGRNEYNNWELDGGDNMDNGSNATLNVYPNLEAIAEFKVLTSNYGAQYGRNGSGTIEVETKSGTNAFHGSAFYYGRNEVFNANDFFDNAVGNPRAPYRKHDFGYTVGGPVFIPRHYNSDKKKTFFFFSEEWRREKNVSLAAPGSNGSSIANVPSVAERGGNFNDVCPGSDCPHQRDGTPFPNNTITPTAVGTALEATIPQPTPGLTAGGFPAFEQTVSEPTTWREELVRIDHNLTDNYRLTFRYIHDSWNTVVPDALWGNNQSGNLPSFQNVSTGFVGPGTSFVARLNANVTPTLLNEFVASYTADHIFLTSGGTVSPSGAFPMGTLFPNQKPLFGALLPSITLTSNAAYGGGFWTDTGYFPWNNANPTYTLRDNVTKIVGKHTFQFGAYVVFAQKNEMNSPNLQGILTFSSGASLSTGNAFADLLLGNISSYKQWSAKNKYYNRYKIVEPYFQDDWRVTKRLTLNLGLRVSLFGTYREKFLQAFSFDPTRFNPANEPTFNADGSLAQNAANMANPFNGLVQCGGHGGTFPLVPGSAFPTVAVGANSNAGCLSGHLFNPAPRIGFAFDPKGDGKMAIRGGYGIFYEHTNGNEGNTESLESPASPLALTATQSNIAPGLGTCPANAPQGGYSCIGGAAGGVIPVFPLSPLSIPNKAQWPYMQQWNLGVQRELPAHVVLSVAYVGSKGTHLTLLSNLNQLQPLPAAQNPFGAGETLVGTGVVGPSGPQGACAGPNGNLNSNTALNNQPWLPGQTVPGTNGPLTTQAALNVNVACSLVSPDTVRTAFPGYSSLNSLRDAANSIYHSLQITATRTVGDLTLSLAYAHSHAIDGSSDRSDAAFVDAFNIAANRASSNFDMRHSLSVSYVYNLPFFRGSGLAHDFLGGWQISGITVAQTGLPFTVVNGVSPGDNAGVANGASASGSRPDLVGNPRNLSGNTNPLLFYNPNAYATPRGLTFGNVGRNTLNLPGRLNFNFGLFKRFAIGERAGFEFRAETFNLFNHTQFNSISNSFSPGSSSFLTVNGTHDPRRMQLGLRFYF
jgi:Carboxypeptidase regulatory-like domain